MKKLFIFCLIPLFHVLAQASQSNPLVLVAACNGRTQQIQAQPSEKLCDPDTGQVGVGFDALHTTIRALYRIPTNDIGTEKMDCATIIAHMRYQLQHGADIDARHGDYCATPLMRVAAMGNLTAVVTFLLDQGADKGIITRGEGRNALHYAAESTTWDNNTQDGRQTVDVLLAAGMRVDDTYSLTGRVEGSTALSIAVATIVRIVKDAQTGGYVPHKSNPHMYKKIIHTIQALLQAGAKIQWEDADNFVTLRSLCPVVFRSFASYPVWPYNVREKMYSIEMARETVDRRENFFDVDVKKPKRSGNKKDEALQNACSIQ